VRFKPLSVATFDAETAFDVASDVVLDANANADLMLMLMLIPMPI